MIKYISSVLFYQHYWLVAVVTMMMIKNQTRLQS